MILHTLYSETIFVTDMILKLDKSKIKHSSDILSKNSQAIEKDNMKIIKKKRAIPIQEPDHAKFIKSKAKNENQILDMEVGISSKKKKDIVHKKKNTIANEDQAATRLSSFTNFPGQFYKSFVVVVLIILCVVSTPAVSSFIVGNNYYPDLQESLVSNTAVNIVAAACYIKASMLYLQIIDPVTQAKDHLEEDLAQLNAFSDSLNKYLSDAFYLKDQRLLDISADLRICDNSATAVNTAEKNITHPALCMLVAKSHEDLGWIKGMHEVWTGFALMENDIKFNSTGSPEFYFSQRSFFDFDTLVFYETIGMRTIIAGYITDIQARSTVFTTTVQTLLILTVIIWIIFLLSYKLYWIRQWLTLWTNFEAVFIILNDDLVNNVYIKSYFGSDIDI